MKGEASRKITNKITRKGLPNPRFLTAVNEERLAAQFRKDLAGTYKVLTRKQIAEEYPPERVDELLRRGNQNLAALRGPTVKTMWDYSEYLH